MPGENRRETAVSPNSTDNSYTLTGREIVGWMTFLAFACLCGAGYNYWQFPNYSGHNLFCRHVNCFGLGLLALGMSLFVLCVAIGRCFRSLPIGRTDMIQIILSLVTMVVALYLCTRTTTIFFA